jgi:hypothetical protein
MHEQGRLDERKDFGDAEVVSGMRKTHGKKGGEKRGRRMEDSGREETESCGFWWEAVKESSCGQEVKKLPP